MSSSVTSTVTRAKCFCFFMAALMEKVLFNGVLRTLKEVFQELKKEKVFNILKILGIKCISVLCCYGGLQYSYQEDGMEIKPYYNNTGVLKGTKVSTNIFEFTPFNA